MLHVVATYQFRHHPCSCHRPECGSARGTLTFLTSACVQTRYVKSVLIIQGDGSYRYWCRVSAPISLQLCAETNRSSLLDLLLTGRKSIRLFTRRPVTQKKTMQKRSNAFSVCYNSLRDAVNSCHYCTLLHMTTTAPDGLHCTEKSTLLAVISAVAILRPLFLVLISPNRYVRRGCSDNLVLGPVLRGCTAHRPRSTDDALG